MRNGRYFNTGKTYNADGSLRFDFDRSNANNPWFNGDTFHGYDEQGCPIWGSDAVSPSTHPGRDGEVSATTEIVMGYVLTVADPCAENKTRGKGGSGQGTLIDALQRTPMARAERESYKRRDVDTSYLCRFDGMDYCQWFGRKSDGHFHPIGRVMLLVKVADGNQP